MQHFLITAILLTAISQFLQPSVGCALVSSSTLQSSTCSCQTEIDQLNERIQQLTDSVDSRFEQADIWDLVHTCSVGVKNLTLVSATGGRIPDEDITASSMYAPDHTPPQGRLDFPGRLPGQFSGAWVAGIEQPGEWIQVDLGKNTVVTGVITQGRADAPYTNQMITSFKVMYGNFNETESMHYVQNSTDVVVVFEGNYDASSYVLNTFPYPVSGRFFRIVAETWNVRIATRFDYVTCLVP